MNGSVSFSMILHIVFNNKRQEVKKISQKWSKKSWNAQNRWIFLSSLTVTPQSRKKTFPRFINLYDRALSLDLLQKTLQEMNICFTSVLSTISMLFICHSSTSSLSSSPSFLTASSSPPAIFSLPSHLSSSSYSFHLLFSPSWIEIHRSFSTSSAGSGSNHSKH